MKTDPIEILNQTDSERILVDIHELSKKLCSFPIHGQLYYATSENFLGRIVDGYSEDSADIFLLTIEVANKICEIQNELNTKNLGLFIFDAYRPLRAVKDFANWFYSPIIDENELLRKKIHFPNVKHKSDLVDLGYAPNIVSRHNFGNSIDLTLMNVHTLELLNMGAIFDYFDEISHNTASIEQIGEIAYSNRIILKDTMEKYGFIPYEKEFWHFDYYKRETDKPMDIQIIKKFKGLNANLPNKI